MHRRALLPVVVGTAILVSFAQVLPVHAAAASGGPPVASTTATAAGVQQQKKPKDNGDLIVYVTKTGAKYRAAGCSSLRKSALRMKLRDTTQSYGPCKNCRPPIYQTCK